MPSDASVWSLVATVKILLIPKRTVRDAKLAELVDLRYFCGYTFDEIAAQRGTSVRTVKREWEKARAYLFHQLQGEFQSADACRSSEDQ